jgi:hypothetical protein
VTGATGTGEIRFVNAASNNNATVDRAGETGFITYTSASAGAFETVTTHFTASSRL